MDGWVDGKAGLRIAYSNQKLFFLQPARQPGPASTVVERPLRKISSEGTAVRFPPQDNFSFAKNNSHKGLTEIQYKWTGTSNLATSISGSC